MIVTRTAIAVVGSRGQVARALVRVAAERGINLVARGRPEADLTERAGLAAFLAATNPALVVNAAAYTAVDKAEAEREAAFALNAEGPGRLAQLCGARGVPLVHLSTDYVFDGRGTRPYREDDAIAPASVYGASKAAGEVAIRAAQPQHVILRTAWVYDGEGQNFLRTMLRLAATRDEIGVVDDQQGSPTYAIDIANAILDLAPRLTAPASADGPTTAGPTTGLAPWGTYHLTGAGTTTWAGFARMIFATAGPLGFKAARVKAITTADYPTPARRPAYSVLDNGKLAATFGIALPPWQEALARCLAGMRPEPPA